MSSQTRLGGFKILDNMVRLTLIRPGDDAAFPAALCRHLATERINLAFLICEYQNGSWQLNLAAEPDGAQKASALVADAFPEVRAGVSKAGILSLFPHRSDPGITASLLALFHEKGIHPEAVAHSNSAISVVLHDAVTEMAAGALFESFRFGAYRTPADWRLAQKGKEQLYREVVASYQEKQPKVYALEWYRDQELLQMRLNRPEIPLMGKGFTEFARSERMFTFLVLGPSGETPPVSLSFCLPSSSRQDALDRIRGLIPGAEPERISPVAVFSMNGPHFGDRYGIASDLLAAFSEAGIRLPALSCSIHSVMGVVSSRDSARAIETLKGCFEIPSVIRKS